MRSRCRERWALRPALGLRVRGLPMLRGWRSLLTVLLWRHPLLWSAGVRPRLLMGRCRQLGRPLFRRLAVLHRRPRRLRSWRRLGARRLMHVR